MIVMGWYANQKARHEAKKNGQPRPRTGGVGDRISDKLETIVNDAETKLAEARVNLAEINARRPPSKKDRSLQQD
jgi:hypothetical protein